jgi:hypothetical protein
MRSHNCWGQPSDPRGFPKTPGGAACAASSMNAFALRRRASRRLGSSWSGLVVVCARQHDAASMLVIEAHVGMARDCWAYRRQFDVDLPTLVFVANGRRRTFATVLRSGGRHLPIVPSVAIDSLNGTRRLARSQTPELSDRHNSLRLRRGGALRDGGSEASCQDARDEPATIRRARHAHGYNNSGASRSEDGIPPPTAHSGR